MLKTKSLILIFSISTLLMGCSSTDHDGGPIHERVSGFSTLPASSGYKVVNFFDSTDAFEIPEAYECCYDPNNCILFVGVPRTSSFNPAYPFALALYRKVLIEIRLESVSSSDENEIDDFKDNFWDEQDAIGGASEQVNINGMTFNKVTIHDSNEKGEQEIGAIMFGKVEDSPVPKCRMIIGLGPTDSNNFTELKKIAMSIRKK